MTTSGYESLIQPNPSMLTYGKYLKVHELLALQEERSNPKEHDETLFIIIHQVYELWFKQMLHELDHCESMLKVHKSMGVIRSLKRIETIQKVLIHQVDILETMTPDEFNRFRSHLNPASGFQSFQFREFEFRLGLKNTGYFRFFAHDAVATERLQQAFAAPTLYDVFLRSLAEQGLPIPVEVLERDVTQIHEADPRLTRIFQDIYEAPEKNYQLFVLLEGFIDLDELLVLWRYRHVQMVRRMIGELSGTGGSSGAKYLQSTLSKTIFPEIWDVRNHLGRTKPYGG